MFFFFFSCSYFFACSYLDDPPPPVQCSKPFPFSETWHSQTFLTLGFGLMMLWLPEMRMRQLWMIAMRQPHMP